MTLITFSFVAISISTSIFRREDISTVYFCPHTFEAFSKLFNTDKRRFDFFYKFLTNFGVVENKLFSSCHPCILFVEDLFNGVDFKRKHYKVFSRKRRSGTDNFKNLSVDCLINQFICNVFPKSYLQLTLENSNCQGTKKIVPVIESPSFLEMGLKQ